VASAQINTVQIQKPVTARRVTLELTVAEARTLVTVMTKIGGHPDTSLRGQADSVYNALVMQGLFSYEDEDMGEDDSLTYTTEVSLYFKDTTNPIIKPGETD